MHGFHSLGNGRVPEVTAKYPWPVARPRQRSLLQNQGTGGPCARWEPRYASDLDSTSSSPCPSVLPLAKWTALPTSLGHIGDETRPFWRSDSPVRAPPLFSLTRPLTPGALSTILSHHEDPGFGVRGPWEGVRTLGKAAHRAGGLTCGQLCAWSLISKHILQPPVPPRTP